MISENGFADELVVVSVPDEVMPPFTWPVECRSLPAGNSSKELARLSNNLI
jgi:hypothetical protein